MGVRALGRVQEALKDEAAELVERLDAAPAFALTLKKAADRMDEAARRLQDLKPPTTTPARPRNPPRSGSSNSSTPSSPTRPTGGAAGGSPRPAASGGQPGGQQRRGGDGIGLAAQLKVLKMLQQEVNDRTEAIDEIKTRKKTPHARPAGGAGRAWPTTSEPSPTSRAT